MTEELAIGHPVQAQDNCFGKMALAVEGNLWWFSIRGGYFPAIWTILGMGIAVPILGNTAFGPSRRFSEG